METRPFLVNGEWRTGEGTLEVRHRGRLTNVLGPFVEPIELNVNGTKSSVKVGSKVTAEMTTHVSPVDPTMEQEVHVVIPTGFVFQDAQAARNVRQDVNVDGMTFADTKTNAFYAAVEHSN